MKTAHRLITYFFSNCFQSSRKGIKKVSTMEILSIRTFFKYYIENDTNLTSPYYIANAFS